jgi:DNA-binding MarR family transcriptional regulator
MNKEPLTTPTIGFVLHDVARLLRKRFEQRARSLGLTRSQFQVLAHLAKREGIQQSALADALDIEPITLGRILDKLAAGGFIERRPHASDRRIWLLYLTPKARPVLDLMQEPAEKTRAEALKGVSEKDREQLLATLGRMKVNLIEACNSPCNSTVEELEIHHA